VRLKLAGINKFGAKRTTVDGIVFASALEARVYQRLKLRQYAGQISGLRLQVPFVLQEAFTDSDGKRQRNLRYVADFTFVDGGGQQIACDSKGKVTREFLIKAKLFRFRYPNIRLEVVTE
jgi:hypothetical protein